jgi:hypothetical protein
VAGREQPHHSMADPPTEGMDGTAELDATVTSSLPTMPMAKKSPQTKSVRACIWLGAGFCSPGGCSSLLWCFGFSAGLSDDGGLPCVIFRCGRTSGSSEAYP